MVEVAVVVKTLRAPSKVRVDWIKAAPPTDKRAPGVEVPMPRRLALVLAVKRLVVPALSRTSRAKLEVVEILRGSLNKREAYCPPRASRVVVPEASVEKDR